MSRHDSTKKNTLQTKTWQATWTAGSDGGTRLSTINNLRGIFIKNRVQPNYSCAKWQVVD